MYETIRPSTFISVMLRGWFVKLVTLSYGYTHAILLITIVKCYIFGKSHVNFLHFFEPACELHRAGSSSLEPCPAGLGSACTTFEPSLVEPEPSLEPRASGPALFVEHQYR